MQNKIENGNETQNQLITSPQQQPKQPAVLDHKAELLVERFLVEADIAPTTKATYRRALAQFMLWHAEHGNGDLARADVLAYKQYQLSKVQASTVSTYLTALKSFTKWLESEKIYPNIASNVKGVRLAKGHRRDALTVEQARHVLRTLKGDTLQAKRNFALFNLLTFCGLRTIEVERALVSDLRTKNGSTVLMVQGKGRLAKDDYVVLVPKASQPLFDYLAARRASGLEALGPDSPLFASLSNKTYGKPLVTRSLREIIKNAMRAAGYDSPRWTAHSLRHSAVTYALQAGASIQQTQAMARHSSINTTIQYAHNLDRLNNAAEHAIEDLLGDI